jgi:hypothetical protein
MDEIVPESRVEGIVITSVEDVKKFLEEGKELLEKGEVVQSCEKIYKAAEDAMKILAKEHAPDVYEEAGDGRWLASLLKKVVRAIESRLIGGGRREGLG